MNGSCDTVLRQAGYRFSFNPHACETCNGACCRGESGYIWVRFDEIEALSHYVNLSLDEFATMYLRKVKHRFSLKEKKLGEGDFACIFFDEAQQRCSVYPVRPKQCRTFPFWEHYQDKPCLLQRECPGIYPDEPC